MTFRFLYVWENHNLTMTTPTDWKFRTTLSLLPPQWPYGHVTCPFASWAVIIITATNPRLTNHNDPISNHHCISKNEGPKGHGAFQPNPQTQTRSTSRVQRTTVTQTRGHPPFSGFHLRVARARP